MDLPRGEEGIRIFDMAYGHYFLANNFPGYSNLPVPFVYGRIEIARIENDKPSLALIRFFRPSPSVYVLMQYGELGTLL